MPSTNARDIYSTRTRDHSATRKKSLHSKQSFIRNYYYSYTQKCSSYSPLFLFTFSKAYSFSAPIISSCASPTASTKKTHVSNVHIVIKGDTFPDPKRDEMKIDMSKMKKV